MSSNEVAALLLLLVTPLLGGILLGGYTRQLEAPGYLGPAVFLAGPLLGLLAAWIPLGFWNLEFVGSVFATAYWVAAWARAPGRTLLALGFTMCLSLGALELAARLFMSDHPLLQGVGASQPAPIPGSGRRRSRGAPPRDHRPPARRGSVLPVDPAGGRSQGRHCSQLSAAKS